MTDEIETDAPKPGRKHRGPNRPKVDTTASVLESPEFRALLAQETAKAVAAIAQAGLQVPANADTGTKQLFSEMALAIAEMNNQGSGRSKPVAPEIIQQRQQAAEDCLDMVRQSKELIRAHGKEASLTAGYIPTYRVVSKVYLNETLIEPYKAPETKGGKPTPTEIYWDGVPNEAMRPTNARAEQIWDAYRRSIGGVPRVGKVKGPHGGVVEPDNRSVWVTMGGHIVKGDAPAKAFVAAPLDHNDDLGVRDNNDPNAPYIHVLGTIAAPARQNILPGQR
jgi:hypothetical protein